MPKCPQCNGNTRSPEGELCCRCERNNFLMKKYGNLGPRKKNRGETVPLDATKTIENALIESKSKVWEGLDKKVSMTNRKTAEMKEKVEPVCDESKKVNKPEECLHYKQYCPMIRDNCYPAHVRCTPHKTCSKDGHHFTR